MKNEIRVYSEEIENAKIKDLFSYMRPNRIFWFILFIGFMKIQYYHIIIFFNLKLKISIFLCSLCTTSEHKYGIAPTARFSLPDSAPE